MPANEPEGMTDEDEWLTMNDEEQTLIYLCCVRTQNESTDPDAGLCPWDYNTDHVCSIHNINPTLEWHIQLSQTCLKNMLVLGLQGFMAQLFLKEWGTKAVFIVLN